MRTDPARLEMMRSYFNAIASGMGHVIERTSFTTFVKESADFATALATPDGEFFVYPKTVGVTIFLGLSLKRAIEESGPFEPGDIVITNDPYTTDGLATHLPDIHVFKPIFIDGEIISYAWAFVHCSDVGGMVPASISPTATDIHQEGLRIPPVKIYKAGKENREVLQILRANSRVPDLNEGDINAMIAAVKTAESRLKAMIGKFGKDAVRQGMDDLLEQASMRAGKVIGRIPDGTYSFSDYLDDDMISDIPIRLAVSAKVAAEKIALDFSDCDPQVQTAFNLVTNGTKHSFLYQGLINYIISEDPYIPVNGGLTRPIEVIAPKGTLVHPEYPAAVGIRHSITMRLYNAVLGALAKALPEAVPAAGAGQSAIVVLSVPDESSGGRKMSVVEPMGGGGGGQHDMDGADGIDHASGFLKNTPIESLEQHIDIYVHRYELVKDTAGAGLHRGGHAIGLEFEAVAPESIVTARGMERLRFQPWGLAGGKAGSLGRVRLHPGQSDEKMMPKIDVLKLEQGDIVNLQSPGGGGWGDPFIRKAELVLKEVEEELLSEEAALQRYGVALRKNESGRLSIDDEKTNQIRREKAGRARKHWDFGRAREEYEQRWTEEASTALARMLRKLPANQRSHVKHLVHDYVLKKGRSPVSKEAVAAVFEKLGVKNNAKMER
ncbi:hydantoinase B/oxoprolinase family protein [Bacillus sonorensis]|uniref:hydantoinase B/oxoprolinase family protein n=1 Tax=Bacillus sonorensis TaxID=119858 RepID=UPI001F254E5F|nr:hydantoinase B/oxoprolinase family protein [Bacillus sonorensis]MCF7619916.1 hydantoinase B/oxoprolinase family protein [Bacillus sonorensis]MCY7857029.1 hydantoinase B/oxoprolinase family protein [Bacillus sonorensis]MCY8270473.1 hydantoinase B/oxoprolinase family protein [Bacillus sonorensis]MCY8603153.1 hydantoinase B/oxoprolinase family protein [Bacillus sonorensis]MEC1355300.1 hydantoinase B/oxoprolinase family protein [Bacillus sonorensis]